jgi:hypothetical protein
MLRSATLFVALGCMTAGAAAAQTGAHTARVSTSAASTSADSRPIELYREMVAALVRADTATLAKIWAPGYTFTNTSADSTIVLTRAERLRAIAEEARDTSSALESATIDGCTIRTYATFAEGPCRATLHWRNGSQRRVTHALAIALFTRNGRGRWQILATHTGELSSMQ